MDKINGGLKKAYGEMLFCWQETAAGGMAEREATA